jgi:hypothetical protein
MCGACLATPALSRKCAQGGDDASGRPGGRAGAAVAGAARAVAKGLLRGGDAPPALQCCVMSVCLVRRCCHGVCVYRKC